MKNCSFCGAENEDAAVFCEECGKSFSKKCDKCGAENKLTAKFCNKCGTRFIAPNTICYTATEKIESSWIDKKSISHDFEDGNGYIVLKDGVNSISGGIFKDCIGLTALTIPDSVTEITIPYWSTDEYKELLPGNVWNKLKEVPIFHTIYYEATEKLDRQWIDKNSISHEFANGKGKIRLKFSVTKIGVEAFYDCRGLTSITIPNSVKSIGNSAFYGCSGLTAFTIPNSVTSIGKAAFSGCCGLKAVSIPQSVESIGGGAFKNCTSLTSINFNATNCKTMGRYSFDDSIVFKNCKSLSILVIGENVTNIPDYAFHSCRGLTGTLTIPNSVTSIGESAFIGCSGLSSVTIPESVTSIGRHAFALCSGLTSVTIPNSVTSIGESAFLLVRNIVYNGTATGSRWDALCVNGFVDGYLIYSDNKKTKLIGCCSFATEVIIPSSVTSIGNATFLGCGGLTSVSIPNSVTSIGNQAFWCCSELTEVTIPNSVTSIGNQAFWCCSELTEVTIPNSVTSIGRSAFSYCNKLRTITIPNSVKEIGDYAFCGCNFPKDIKENIKKINENAFDDGCVNDYEYEPTELNDDISDAFEGDPSALWNVD